MRDLLHLTVAPVLAWMGGRYDDPSAAAMLLAAAKTESDVRHRRQRPGPARSYFQIEPATGVDVLVTRPQALKFWGRLNLPGPEISTVRAALEFSDAGACVIARELLWFRVKRPLPPLDPGEEAASDGLVQYLAAWRPGKPHPERFLAAWPEAVEAVVAHYEFDPGILVAEAAA